MKKENISIQKQIDALQAKIDELDSCQDIEYDHDNDACWEDITVRLVEKKDIEILCDALKSRSNKFKSLEDIHFDGTELTLTIYVELTDEQRNIVEEINALEEEIERLYEKLNEDKDRALYEKLKARFEKADV